MAFDLVLFEHCSALDARSPRSYISSMPIASTRAARNMLMKHNFRHQIILKKHETCHRTKALNQDSLGPEKSARAHGLVPSSRSSMTTDPPFLLLAFPTALRRHSLMRWVCTFGSDLHPLRAKSLLVKSHAERWSCHQYEIPHVGDLPHSRYAPIRPGLYRINGSYPYLVFQAQRGSHSQHTC